MSILLKQAIADLRREGLIITAEPITSRRWPISRKMEHAVVLYASGLRGEDLARHLGITVPAAQQRLKMAAAALRLASVKDLPGWAERSGILDEPPFHRA